MYGLAVVPHVFSRFGRELLLLGTVRTSSTCEDQISQQRRFRLQDKYHTMKASPCRRYAILAGSTGFPLLVSMATNATYQWQAHDKKVSCLVSIDRRSSFSTTCMR